MLKNSLSIDGTDLIVYMPEEVDHLSASDLRIAADLVLENYDIHRIVFDFSNTEFMDSSGIGVLLSRYKQMEGSRGTVRIYGAGPRITRILTIGGIMRLVKKCDTREEAIYG